MTPFLRAILVATLLIMLAFWSVIHGQAAGFQLTGWLERTSAVPQYTIGKDFTIIVDDPSLRALLSQMEGKKVVLRVEVKK